MLRSLRQISLANYSYRQVKDFCSDPSFYNVFDCQWGVWRDKAVADFGISPEFFDLVPTLSGSQRYLQISTYERLTEDSLAKSVDEGVYEAVAGFKEAVMRDDYDMVLFFYHNLSEIQKQYILTEWESMFLTWPIVISPTSRKAKKLISFGLVEHGDEEEVDDYFLVERGSEEAFQRLLDDVRRKDASHQQRMDFLYSVLISGRLDFIDAIIHDYFVLPEGFSINKDIPYVPFWEYRGEVLYDLPPQEHIHHIEVTQIAESVLTGCNSRVVDFFRSMFRGFIEENKILVPVFLQRGMRIQTLYPRSAKAEEVYSISKRFPRWGYDFMSEFLLKGGDLDVEDFKDSQGNFVYSLFIDVAFMNDGNLTLITSILPYFDKREVERHLYRIGKRVYPLEYQLV
ncbi:Hypothetical protein ZAZAV_306 [Cedratvirus Zaza IHUMI]|uniref:Uncharacterized protein n=1 Tax=Cedratvirus Zaza IHUMI TaxID=2126979 RepID=A0A2R8FEI9_9VIRU|nr:Hypothetical protein ZAZAV_306 [Cedratvirus Zaza IHUMI]